MRKRLRGALLAAVMLWTLAAPALGAWYDPAVQRVTELGLMTGTGQGFEPLGLVTRAMVFQTLYNREGPATGAPEGDGPADGAAFPDAAGKWYAQAANWAFETGLAQGTGGGFDGDRAATRGEIVTVLYRYAQMVGADVSVGLETNILSYEDAENVPPWAVPAFQWAVGAGVVAGRDGTLLAPNDVATRGELAQMLCNCLPVWGTPDPLDGQAASINKYGDVVTTLTAAALEQAGAEVGDVLRVWVGGQRVDMPWLTHYDDAAQGQPLALAEDGVLRLCLSRGDFATAYGVGSRGDSAVYELAPTAVRVEIPEDGERVEPLGLGDKLSGDRADYADDETFANFRAVAMGDIAPGVLYRSASPIEAAAGRGDYADRLLGEAGVRTIVNMADCRAKAPLYDAFAGTHYAAVHEGGGVVYLNMGSDMYAQVGRDDLRNGLEFMTEREGPYLIHSTYGADRTGYMLFLLEALMGADVEEIVDDYMRSFEDLYHIQPGSDAWRALAQGGVEADLLRLLEAPDMDAARSLARSRTATGATVLEYAAQRYLVDQIGLTEGQVQILKEHLSNTVKSP